MAQEPANLNPDASPWHLLGAEIRHRRTQQGLSQNELGRMVHISGDLVCKWEKAVRRPSPELLEHVDRVLDARGYLLRLAALARAADRASQAAGACGGDAACAHSKPAGLPPAGPGLQLSATTWTTAYRRAPSRDQPEPAGPEAGPSRVTG